MRRLIQPNVLRSATIAALITTLACHPRLTFWDQPLPVQFLEGTVFLCTLVLWAFVFAWHTHYTGRPVFTLRIEPKWFVTATAIGVCSAAILRWFVDPTLRMAAPVSYPNSPWQWLAMALFSASLSQLVLVFAPFAWLMRLSRNQTISAALTMLVGVGVLVMKTRAAEFAAPSTLLAALLVLRIMLGICAVLLYLQGGVLLVWWCGLLIEARHLIYLASGR